MKQLIQSFKTGETTLEDIPMPHPGPNEVLIQTTYSLVSKGTEKMLVDFGKANLLSKVRKQPDKVKLVIDKIKSDGLLPTLDTVYKKLEQPIPLGYCNVGIVVAVGQKVYNFKPGDRVASNGSHAEYVCVSKNLCTKIPENVSDTEAVFTVIGAIGLQGVRLLDLKFGETVVVYGLGLIGLISAQILAASGCNVIGIDIDEQKIQFANQLGIKTANSKSNIEEFVLQETNGYGTDGVLITASTKSDAIISESAKISKRRGKVVLVGVIGLNLNRADFYEKEISFQVSCSYGPGRYDDDYESKGIDYPFGFVRWTENRNFEAILNSISNNRINVEKLITSTFDFSDYKQVYDNLDQSKSLGTLFRYAQSDDNKSDIVVITNKKPSNLSHNTVGIIGAGNFTKMTLLPNLKKNKINVNTIASKGGLNGTILAKKYSIANSTTNYKSILGNKEISDVIITTRHDSHAELILECLDQNKNVFVEKPLCIKPEELEKIIDRYNSSTGKVIVGYNRRFSPHSKFVKKNLAAGPKKIIANMNAGDIPENSWVHDMEIGGGRIIGEACHLIDLITFFTESTVVEVNMMSLGKNPKLNTDSGSIQLKYADGSLGIINYFSIGPKSYSKERIEVYQNQKCLIIDNFKTTRGYGFSKKLKLNTKLDKGHSSMLSEYFVQSSKEIIPFSEIINTSSSSFAALESMMSKKWIRI